MAVSDELVVEWLNKVVKCNDRATLAILRDGLAGSSGRLRMYPCLGWLLSGKSERSEDAILTVASLFASWHHGGRVSNGQPVGGDFGWTLKEIVRRNPNKRKVPIERRFAALLDTMPRDLLDALDGLVKIARDDNVPIDWLKLIKHIRNWDNADHFVQRSWARSFWSKVSNEEGEE